MGTGSINGDTQKKMIFITLAFFVVVCYIIYKLPGECHGSCEQGRKSCDCKDDE